MAVILVAWGMLFLPSGIWPFIAGSALFYAGVAGALKETVLSVIATGIITILIFFFFVPSFFPPDPAEIAFSDSLPVVPPPSKEDIDAIGKLLPNPPPERPFIEYLFAFLIAPARSLSYFLPEPKEGNIPEEVIYTRIVGIPYLLAVAGITAGIVQKRRHKQSSFTTGSKSKTAI